MATVKELIEGIALDAADDSISNITDAIDVLGESRIIMTTDRKQMVEQSVDSYDVTAMDKYGDTTGAAGADSANEQDRTWLSSTYAMDFGSKLEFTIPRGELARFGITSALLNADLEAIDDVQLAAIVDGLSGEIKSLSRKMREFRRAQVTTCLKNLGLVGASASQKPLGLLPVDTSVARTTAWAYTNKLSAALDAAEFKNGINIFASFQKNAANEEYKASEAQLLFHASDFSLAATIALPDVAVNIDNRNTGDALSKMVGGQQGVSAVATYGDSAHASDWILLGANHRIYRKAFYVVGDTNNNGLSARCYIKESNGAFVMVLENNSQMVVDSAIDIVKAIV